MSLGALITKSRTDARLSIEDLAKAMIKELAPLYNFKGFTK